MAQTQQSQQSHDVDPKAIECRLSDEVSQNVKDAIENGIDSFSNDVVGETRTPCFVTLYDGDFLVGGLRAESLGQWFYIKHLWVAEQYRGHGFGFRLMARAEDEAAKRGCRVLWVDTLSYQAPEFYEKLGFAAQATIPEYRGVHSRIFFKKEI